MSNQFGQPRKVVIDTILTLKLPGPYVGMGGSLTVTVA